MAQLDTIKSSEEISFLFANGKRIHTSYMTLIVLPQQHDRSTVGGRVAFVAGKKQGNAVWRNAAKRRMREVCREVGGPWPHTDVVFLAKAPIAKASHATVMAACQDACQRAGLGKK